MKKIVLLLIFVFCFAVVRAKPLFNLESPVMNLYSDQAAHQVGDILIVQVDDSLIASQNGQEKTQKGFDIPFPVGGGLFHFLGNLFQAQGSAGSNASRQFSNQNSLTTNFAVVVQKVYPNGVMAISGTHQVVLNNEKEFITLSGLVREKDLDASDTVLSSDIADLTINVRGATGNSTGIIPKILRFLF